ncbi:MAG: hypothetical protein RR348_02350, partial [Clostridia bacterium]
MTEEEEAARRRAQQEEADDYAELQRLQREYEACQRQLSRAIDLRATLTVDCNGCQVDVQSAQNKVTQLNKSVTPQIKKLEPPLATELGITKDLLSLLGEIKEKYIRYKNAGEASKTLTGLYEKYFTYFKNYNELRQVALAYIIGVDAHIWSSDTPRKTVEETYLANTNYWLAYASMAVVLWSSDERSACERAINQSMQMNEVKSSLFYLLVCLRFDRLKEAKQWYVIYMNLVNKNAIGDDMKYILQALLSGSFGADRDFEKKCIETIRDMFVSLHESCPTIDSQIHNEIMHYFDCFVSVTSKEFVHLHRNCKEYDIIMKALSDAEKNKILYNYFEDIYSEKEQENCRLSSKIEESLYSLINDYDDDEKALLDKIKYNDLIVKSMGDKKSAEESYNAAMALEYKPKNLAIFMCDVAMDYDDNTPSIVKKFAMKYMAKYCDECAEEYGQSYVEARVDKYNIDIDGWKCCTDENGFEQNKQSLIKHYHKIIRKSARADKSMRVSCAVSMAALMIAIIFFGLAVIPSMLIVGIVIGVIGVGVSGATIYAFFAQWNKIKLANKKMIEYGLKNFDDTLDEIKLWKESFDMAHA